MGRGKVGSPLLFGAKSRSEKEFLSREALYMLCGGDQRRSRRDPLIPHPPPPPPPMVNLLVVVAL